MSKEGKLHYKHGLGFTEQRYEHKPDYQRKKDIAKVKKDAKVNKK